MPLPQLSCRYSRISSHPQSSWQRLSRILGIVRQALGVRRCGVELGGLTIIGKGYLDRVGCLCEEQREHCER